MLRTFFEKLFFLVTVAVAITCAIGLRMNYVTPGSGVHVDFIEYVNSFNALAIKHLGQYCQPDVDIGYGNLRNMPDIDNDGRYAIGLCIPTEPPTIVVDENYWARASQLDKETLIYHELGHCVLDLDHNELQMDFKGHKQPASIMFPSAFSESVYADMKDYYISELFDSVNEKVKDKLRNCEE